VGNVISNPEEAAYKRVRLQGVHYKTKLGAFGPGGMHCLVAAGFQVQREEEEEEGGEEGGIVLPGARVLVMVEPDMMVKQAEWTAWYDACKGVRDRLQEEVTRVRRL